MSGTHSLAVTAAATLVLAILIPGQALSQQTEAEETPELVRGPPSPAGDVPRVTPLAVRHFGTGCSTRYRFQDRGVLDIDPRSGRDFDDTFAQHGYSACFFRGQSNFRSLYGWDGDYGRVRPNPASPGSYTYPDTRFDLATALQRLEAKRTGQRVPDRATNTVPTKARPPMAPVREPPGETYTARSTRLPVRTSPVMTRQIMEQRILRGQVQRGEIERSEISGKGADYSDGPDTPRSAARRAARTRPAAARSAAPARSSRSARPSPSSSSKSSGSKSSRKGSTQADP